jgi:heme-degrading monooxygenase HmoA
MAPYTCSATRIRLNRLRDMPGFLRDSALATIAARRTPGNVSTRLLGMPPFPVFFTFTVWESPEAMADFVKTERHRTAMARMGRYARTGSFVRFSATRRRPTWRHAFRALRDPDGRYTPEGQFHKPAPTTTTPTA